MNCKTCGEHPCRCKVFEPEEAKADVFDLSEYEKAVILEFRTNCPNFLPPGADVNDFNNLSDHEKTFILEFRKICPEGTPIGLPQEDSSFNFAARRKPGFESW